MTQCDDNVPCRACVALGADCTKTIEPMHRGPRSKALRSQHEIVGHGTATSTTSDHGGSSPPKRRRLNTNQAQEAVGGMSSPITSLWELPFEISKHAYDGSSPLKEHFL